jgi:hypothetical protein
MTTPTPTRNGAALTAQAAMVHTAQVEIQILRVGKKQVTLSMFRQLPVKPLVDWWAMVDAERYATWEEASPLTLQGVPWGHVNYWWSGNETDNNDYINEQGELDWRYRRCSRLHLVWQDDAGLYRDIVYWFCPKDVLDYGEVAGQTPILAARERDIEQWWRHTFQALRALPQLFIAV